MVIEYAENIVQLLANLAALLMCMLYFIGSKHRGWFYAVVFFLSSLLSCYYWTSYQIIIGDWPNVSDFITYLGWNTSYCILLILLLHMKSPEERRYFHPLMLLPVPLNIWQLTLYLPYGKLFNNIYQVAVCTALACFSIQGFCWYRKQREEGMKEVPKPYISAAVFLFSLFEFGMWTSTCLNEPYSDLYYPFSFLFSLNYLFLVWSIRRTYIASGSASRITFDRKYQNILKASCLGIVLAFSLGGILLGVWMRDVTVSQPEQGSGSGIYEIIPIVLFIISLFLIIFVIAVIFIVVYAQRAAENSKLREARQIAERSNAAKSEFLANMSHEIRTPINAVMGMNEIILRESRQARDRLPEDRSAVQEIFADICGYAGVIDSAGKNLLSVISDILDFSRIEAGKLEINEDSYLLSSVLRDVYGLIHFRTQAQDLAFAVNVDESLPDRLFGDALRVRQIMLNILGNAVKYTKKGSVTLSVFTDAQPVPEAGQMMDLVFSVRDTGIGIRPEDRDRLFDKFERLKPAEHDHVEGTGLGLAICRSLLDMMNGRIQVESVYGEGSEFTVTIPQKVMSPEPIGSFRKFMEHRADSADIPQDTFRAPDARVLIVDDTYMNIAVVEGLLRKTRIRTDTADSGEAALQCTLTVPYDLIFMDQRMPGMDGTETLRRIREQEHGLNRETPVVCLTADVISGAKERYLKEGFSDYLSKPIDSRVLRKMLSDYLPPDKVTYIPAGESDPAHSSAPLSGSGVLRSAGIDPEQGLKYCRQDTDLYRSLLAVFAENARENIRRLEQYYASAAWKEYGILVHSVKSTAATIGAAGLSEMAAGLESAARNGDKAALDRTHPLLLPLYRKAADAARTSGISSQPAVPGQDSVMEFNPE